MLDVFLETDTPWRSKRNILQIILMNHLKGEFLQEQPTQDVIDPSFVSDWPDVCSVLNDPFTKLWERQDLSLDNVHCIHFQLKAYKQDQKTKPVMLQNLLQRRPISAVVTVLFSLSLFGPI